MKGRNCLETSGGGIAGTSELLLDTDFYGISVFSILFTFRLLYKRASLNGLATLVERNFYHV